jgi:hypothetical protein
VKDNIVLGVRVLRDEIGNLNSSTPPQRRPLFMKVENIHVENYLGNPGHALGNNCQEGSDKLKYS